MELRPLEGYVVAPERAAEAVAPPYDALTPAQRATHVERHPASFLSVLPEEPDDASLADAAAALDRLVDDGVYRPEPGRFVGVYRLTEGGHEQTGIVADLAVSEIAAGRVHAHEHTHPDRVADLVRFLEVVGVSSSPVSLAHRPDPDVARTLAEATTAPPRIDLTDPDGVRQQLWIVDDDAAIAALLAAYHRVPELYITDGHHRIAAACEFAQLIGDDAGPAGATLAVCFPSDQLQVRDFGRAIRGLEPHGDPDAVRAAIADRGLPVRPLPVPARPTTSGEVSVVLPDGWSTLQLPPDLRDERSTAERLDVALLHREVIAPVLGVEDPRRDRRMHYVPGTVGLEELGALVGELDGVGFVLHPPSVAELMAVAEAGEVMPPKSTYFTPKPRSGLLLRFRP